MSSRSPRVSPAPAFAGVALLKAGGSEEPVVGSGTPSHSWDLDLPTLEPQTLLLEDVSLLFSKVSFPISSSLRHFPTFSGQLDPPPPRRSSSMSLGDRRPFGILLCASHPQAHTHTCVPTHRGLLVYTNLVGMLMPVFINTYKQTYMHSANRRTNIPTGHAHMRAHANPCTHRRNLHEHIPTYMCAGTHPVPLPVPSLGPQGRFQSDGQLSLRSGDPRGAVWRLPHRLVGGGAAQGEGSLHVGRELPPLQLCLRSLGGLRALRPPTATCPAAGLPLRTRSAPRPPAASLWWLRAVGQSLRGG